MEIKKLTSESDQAAFVTAFQQNDGSAISVDYLKHSHVWGFYHQRRLVAGFIINRAAPLRYLEHFTKEDGSKLLKSHHLSDVVEISCIWHERDGQFSVRQKTELYIQSILKALTWKSLLSNAAIMGGSFNEKVARRQKTLLRKQLFRDVIKVNGALRNAQIYYAHTLQVIMMLPMAIGYMIVQEIKKAIVN